MAWWRDGVAMAMMGGVAVRRGGVQRGSQPVSQRDELANHGPREENWPPPNASPF